MDFQVNPFKLIYTKPISNNSQFSHYNVNVPKY